MLLNLDKYKHPSGRPIRQQRVVSPQIWRIPDRGPVIPRLQPEDKKTSAIGFMVNVESSSEHKE